MGVHKEGKVILNNDGHLFMSSVGKLCIAYSNKLYIHLFWNT